MPSFKLALVALAASLVSAQINLADIPSCALQPAVAALGSSGCAETDIKCICDSTAFLNSLLKSVEAVCDKADLCKAEGFAKSLCTSVGVTLNVPNDPCAAKPPPTTAAPPPASTAAPPPPPASSAAPPASSAPAPPASSQAPVHGTGVVTVYVTAPCSASPSGSAIVLPTSPVSNLTVTATKSAKPSVFTGAATAEYVSGVTMFGGVMAALAMLL